MENIDKYFEFFELIIKLHPEEEASSGIVPQHWTVGWKGRVAGSAEMVYGDYLMASDASLLKYSQDLMIESALEAGRRLSK